MLLMVGRVRLTKEELQPLSGFNREQMSHAWRTLAKSFRAAWRKRAKIMKNAQPGALLAYLADAHDLALHFEPPRPHRLPAAVRAVSERNPERFAKVILQHLEERLDGEPRRPKRRPAPERRRASPVRTQRRPLLEIVPPALRQEVQIAAVA